MFMENNPQMDDEAGCYEKEIAQNSTSAFTDLYVYLEVILNEFGGVSVRMEKEKRHVIGIDCVDVLSYSFNDNGLEMTLRNTLPEIVAALGKKVMICGLAIVRVGPGMRLPAVVLIVECHFGVDSAGQIYAMGMVFG